jgi:leader peptidase (prepilin peptidase)/N-methyltransferase
MTMHGVPWSLALWAALPGAAAGSFVNSLALACVGRGSVLRARSACPACASVLAPRDLLPLLSWLMLRGRCRQCHQPISLLYPLAEVAAAVLTAAWALAPLSPGQALWGLGFSLVLLTLALADLWAGLVPDVVVWPALALALAVAAWGDEPLLAWQGAAALGGGLWAVAEGYRLFSGRQGLGLGDVKLGGLLGALLGWQDGAQAVLLAAILGVAWGLARGRRHWGEALAFAPFLALAGVAWMLLRAWELGAWLP